MSFTEENLTDSLNKTWERQRNLHIKNLPADPTRYTSSKPASFPRSPK